MPLRAVRWSHLPMTLSSFICDAMYLLLQRQRFDFVASLPATDHAPRKHLLHYILRGSSRTPTDHRDESLSRGYHISYCSGSSHVGNWTTACGLPFCETRESQSSDTAARPDWLAESSRDSSSPERLKLWLAFRPHLLKKLPHGPLALLKRWLSLSSTRRQLGPFPTLTGLVCSIGCPRYSAPHPPTLPSFLQANGWK